MAGEPPAFAFRPLRSRALARLCGDEGRTAKLVAVVAPVGYGKTVLMTMALAEWRAAGRACLWLALDDREIGVDGVIDAIEARLAAGDARLHPGDALFRGPVPVESRIEALLEALARGSGPLTLCLDNLQACPEPALGRLIDCLCFATRADLQLVFSSTRELPFDVARARLEGRLLTFAERDLAFDGREVADLLGPALVGVIGADGVARVQARTEGWPAAVRMAQIILSHADDPVAALAAFSGSDVALAQLLNRQVLSGFSEALREFLYGLAELRSFGPELCQQAIGGDRVLEHLAYLIERNVFVIPLDRSGRRYRLHGLFRDHLRVESARLLAPKRRQELLVRAARWCERHGDPRDAVDYALASGQAGIANTLLDVIAPQFVRDRGDVPQYLRWLDALHAQRRQAGPEAEFWFVWALAFQRRYDDARKWAATLAARVQRRPEAAQDHDLPRRIAILRTSIDSLTDHLDDAHRGAIGWLREAGDSQDDAFNRSAAHCIVAGYHTNHLAFAAAGRAIAAARESAFQAGSAHVDGWVETYAALALIHEGDYAAADAGLMPALAAARAALGPDSGIAGTMALVSARVAVGMSRDEDAREALDAGLRSARSHGFLEAAACGLEAAVLLWDGTAPLAPLREIAAAYPPRLARMLSAFIARRLLRLGRLDEARAESGRIGVVVDAGRRRSRGVPAATPPVVDALLAALRIELLIATDRHPQASALIAIELRQAKVRDCTLRQVELALDAAAIALRAGQPALAQRQLTRAITMAASRHILRPFADHADTLARVVAETRAASWGFATDDERRMFADCCRRLPGRVGVPAEDGTPRLLGQPTPRELELLRWIEAGLSNQQIADRADVSLTTVKWHLQNLFGKLGVPNRSAAVARARALNLLAR